MEAVSPYVHKYSNNAKLIYPYNLGKKNAYSVNTISDYLKQPNLTPIENRMKQISNTTKLEDAKTYFKQLGADIEKILNPDKETLEKYALPNVVSPKIDDTNNISSWITKLEETLKSLGKYTKKLENTVGKGTLDSFINSITLLNNGNL